MRRQFIVLAALSATPLTGCLTLPKPTPVVPREAGGDEAKAAEAIKSIPGPSDPLRPELAPKFEAFLSGNGLATAPAAAGEPAQLTAALTNKVVYVSDPTRGGESMPGLMARLWVFGPDCGTPLDPDGELIVGLWDNMTRDPTGRPTLLELWHVDRETAKQFRKVDTVGNGYSLLLPWSNYHVDLKQVNIAVRYNSADGRCVASAPQTLTLDHSATLQRAAEKQGLALPSKSGETAPAPLPVSATK